GLGSDLCPAPRWAHLIARFGPEKCCAKILHPEEAAYLLKGNRDRLAERMAGRWALREAFGKALGVGLDGWSWRQLRYVDGRLWAVDRLADQMKERGITRLHATIAHDGGIAFATVILESA
ncbi:MAG TPA: 4'-phosphopantetheinyl transferase superfamily protein, partial [Holophagaceae bacterium]|nr:4'-phosphopantetheinyl transferase superfamily protein [Holophagaceae bacterium]